MAYYGLRTVFTVPTAYGMMKNLILDSHIFELDDIIKEYESRLINPNPVLEYDHREAQESMQAQLCAYGAYGFFDTALSSLVIESLVMTIFCEVIKTCFSHYEDFNNFNIQSYFMIILDVCNTSAEIEIEGTYMTSPIYPLINFLVKTYMILIPTTTT